jgi:hypothetical protein
VGPWLLTAVGRVDFEGRHWAPVKEVRPTEQGSACFQNFPSARALSLVAKIAKLVKRLSTSSVEKLSPISEKFAKTRAEALARS